MINVSTNLRKPKFELVSLSSLEGQSERTETTEVNTQDRRSLGGGPRGTWSPNFLTTNVFYC